MKDGHINIVCIAMTEHCCEKEGEDLLCSWVKNLLQKKAYLSALGKCQFQGLHGYILISIENLGSLYLSYNGVSGEE